MTAISYTAAREDLAATMDKVGDYHAPIIITRNREQAVVMMSLADFEALDETAYLLKNPKNAKRITSAIAQLDAGKGVARAVDLKAWGGSSSAPTRRGRSTCIGSLDRTGIAPWFAESTSSSKTSGAVQTGASASRSL